MMKTLYPLGIAFFLFFSHPVFAESTDQDQANQTRISSNGTFHVTVDSWLKPLKLGRMHAWTADITTEDGQPVTDAVIKVGGGMPIHNHGFPTQPEVTRQIEDGKYLIEGVKFSMRGPWVLFLDITSMGKSDSVAFDITM